MTEPAPPADRLGEVQRLTSALADQVLDAQVMGRLIPREQAVALAQAANLMHDYGLEWPPMLEQALHGLADGSQPSGKPAGKQPTPEDDGGVIEGLTRFMSAFRRERGQP